MVSGRASDGDFWRHVPPKAIEQEDDIVRIEFSRCGGISRIVVPNRETSDVIARTIRGDRDGNYSPFWIWAWGSTADTK